MRDPKRIPIVLEKLQRVWEMTPDQRFGQLVLNIFTAHHMNPDSVRHTFDMEDPAFERMLDDILSGKTSGWN